MAKRETVESSRETFKKLKIVSVRAGTRYSSEILYTSSSTICRFCDF